MDREQINQNLLSRFYAGNADISQENFGNNSYSNAIRDMSYAVSALLEKLQSRGILTDSDIEEMLKSD